MRIVTAASLFFSCGLLAFGASREDRSPALASADSPWNVLAYGGKGDMHGAPICHSLDYFSKSPLPLDFDADFFGEREADLVTHAKITLLGTIAAQRVYELKQTVLRKTVPPRVPDPNAPPTIKVLLVERGPDEFCDIYQNQYTYDPTQETDEAAILDIGGKKVLKTLETDRHTWYLQYWTLEDHVPLHLNPDGLYTAIQSASPPGALPFSSAVNLTGSHFSVDVYGKSPNQGDFNLLGRVDLLLAVEGNKIITLTKSWIPLKTDRAR
jgi:hypothetical protein